MVDISQRSIALMVFIYTTCADRDEAEQLGGLIIEQKLGVCVDFWPSHAMYMWEGKMESREEVILRITTLESRLQAVDDLISANHSYSVPIIAGTDVRRINRPYKEWMVSQIG
jgi:periplasmic divalent cation tolerance protein